MTLSLAELLASARPYWLADDGYQSRHAWSPEDERRSANWKQQWRTRGAEWKALLADVQRELPRHRVREATHLDDAGFRCAIHLPSRRERFPREQLVVGCLSMIAPVYMVYGLQYDDRREPLGHRLFFGSLPPVLLRPAATLARRMEARFGVTGLPPELAATPVPLYVDNREPPHTTLFHALFSSEPARVP